MKKIKLQIKTIYGGILFEYEKEDNNIKDTVRELLRIKEGETIHNADLSGMDLSGVSFDNSRFDNSRFYNSSFYNSSFDNSRFDNSRFYNSRFDNSSFYNSSFYNSSFDNSRFYNSSFDNSRFDNSRFYNSRFDNSRFDNSRFYNSRFDNSSFYNSSFDNSRFYNSRFYNSRFDNSRFDNSRFYNSSFDNSRFDNNTVENLVKSGALEPVRHDFFGRLLVLKNEVPALRQALVEGRVKGSAYTGTCACFMGTMANVLGCSYSKIPGILPDADSDTERWFLGIKEGDTPENSPVVKLTVAWIDEFLSYVSA